MIGKVYKERACKNCGLVFAKRDCPTCAAASRKAWNERNPDKVAAYAIKKRNRPLVKSKASMAGKERYERNKEDIKRICAAKYNAEREKYLARSKAWASANRDKRAVISQNRRARLKQNGGKLSADIVKKLFSLQKSKCACCGKSLKPGYHIDHIIPLALGGKNEDSNIQLLTPACNSKKHAKHPVDYMQEMGKLI